MKLIQFKAGTSEEARKYMSELPAGSFNEGDEAEVTYLDGTKHIYVFQSTWVEKGNVIIP